MFAVLVAVLSVHAAQALGAPEQFLRFDPAGRGVQHNPTIYPIFWGSNWNQGPGVKAREEVMTFYRGLSDSTYQETLTQYFDYSGHISKKVEVTAAPFIDTASRAPQGVTLESLEEEVHHAISQEHWVSEINAQFVVLLAPGSTISTNFIPETGGRAEGDAQLGCWGWHSSTLIGESPFEIVTYPSEGLCQLTSDPSHATTDIASHEYAETATDPVSEGLQGMWNSSPGEEVADACQGEGVFELPDHVWVQKLLDNDLLQCVLATVAPPLIYAYSEQATADGPTHAVFHGTLNPEGYPTSYYFEYGTSMSYGTRTPVLSSSATTADEQVAQPVHGLQPGTTYYLRLVASNTTGFVHGIARTYTTPPRAWRLVEAASPPGAAGAGLAGVSCTSDEVCVAAGSYRNGEGTSLALTEQSSGAGWTIMPVEDEPAKVGVGFGNRLSGVSCSTPDACVAVGYYTPTRGAAQAPLAERWTGSEWSLQHLPKPAAVGSHGDPLTAVACASATSCIAVGNEHLSGGTLPFAERWNGFKWRAESMATPSHDRPSEVDAVSCDSSGVCTAVGSYESGGGRSWPLAESSSGSGWVIHAPPRRGTALEAVSCPSPTACTAVASYLAAGGVRHALADDWNGSEWSTSKVVVPQKATATWLHGVWCATAEECTVIGGYTTGASEPASLIETRTGTTWNQLPAPSLPTGSTAAGAAGPASVSCGENSHCAAVGSLIVEAGEEQPLAEEF